MDGQLLNIESGQFIVHGDSLDVSNQLHFSENEKSFHYELEVPGFKKKQLQLVLIGNMLLIEGNKKEKKNNATVHANGDCNEYCFKTILDLPTEIEPKRIKAFFKKHLLMLEVPKLRHSKVRPLRIAIQ
ncbi:MAG: Hsp20/alpha crystallin family protein [Sphingobacteriales bacterium]|nr:Hsp20/alpha crystallin family protein [Sphingobacteriales bacterium]